MIQGLDNVGLAVSDLDRMLDFYTATLGFAALGGENDAWLTLGDLTIISLSPIHANPYVLRVPLTCTPIRPASTIWRYVSPALSRKAPISKRRAFTLPARSSASRVNSAIVASPIPKATCCTSSSVPRRQCPTVVRHPP